MLLQSYSKLAEHCRLIGTGLPAKYTRTQLANSTGYEVPDIMNQATIGRESHNLVPRVLSLTRETLEGGRERTLGTRL